MEELKKYCVYAHYYNDELFYIGSGRIYTKEERSTSRPYRFDGRSQEWYEFCNRETHKIKVEILFRTNDKRESLNIEEHITEMYMERAPLANKNIGAHITEEHKRKLSEANKGKIFSEEHRKNLSLAQRGENHPMWGKNHTKETRKKMSLAKTGEKSVNWGKKLSDEHRRKISKNNANSKKVLVINNEINEEEIFDSVTRAYQFIVEHGFDKAKGTLRHHLRKGPYNFENYTMELAK